MLHQYQCQLHIYQHYMYWDQYQYQPYQYQYQWISWVSITRISLAPKWKKQQYTQIPREETGLSVWWKKDYSCLMKYTHRSLILLCWTQLGNQSGCDGVRLKYNEPWMDTIEISEWKAWRLVPAYLKAEGQWIWHLGAWAAIMGFHQSLRRLLLVVVGVSLCFLGIDIVVIKLLYKWLYKWNLTDLYSWNTN